MPDELMDSLKQAFMKDKDKTADPCPMADQTSAYALGELGSDESQKAKEHIHSCRYCLDLFMDIRMAQEHAESVKDEKVDVLPGLQAAINQGKKPPETFTDKIRGIFSDWFGKGFGLKPVGAIAVLVLCVGLYVLWENGGITPGRPYSIQILMQGRTQVGFRGGQPEYKLFQVEPGGTMNSGDYFRFQTKIDKDAFVYVIFQDSAGNIGSREKGFIPVGKELFIPEGDKWYQLDKTTGTEKIHLIASKKKIDDFDKKVEELKAGGIDTIAKVFPKVTIQSFAFEHR